MKKSLGICSIAALLSVSFVNAAESDATDWAFDLGNLQWYASINAAYLKSTGDVNFFGNTASIYGGTPTIDFDDGGKASLAFGFEAPGNWRVEGNFGYLNLRTDTSPVFGIDDRIDDIFSVDAEVESLVFMLNGIYDFDMGSSKFTPFVKGGIGVARNKTTQVLLDVQYNSAIWEGSVLEGQSVTDFPYPGGTSTEFAWNISAGMKMALSERFALLLEYGFVDLGQALTETNDNGDALGFDDLATEQLSFGVEFRF